MHAAVGLSVPQNFTGTAIQNRVYIYKAIWNIWRLASFSSYIIFFSTKKCFKYKNFWFFIRVMSRLSLFLFLLSLSRIYFVQAIINSSVCVFFKLKRHFRSRCSCFCLVEFQPLQRLCFTHSRLYFWGSFLRKQYIVLYILRGSSCIPSLPSTSEFSLSIPISFILFFFLFFFIPSSFSLAFLFALGSFSFPI